jgi:hypothetical protein
VIETAAPPPLAGRIRRFVDWALFAFFVLAIGPAIGGFIIGILFSAAPLVFHGIFQWSYLSLAIGLPVSSSYYAGEPTAALALVILFVFLRLWRKNTIVLAALSGALAAVLVQAVVAIRRNGGGFSGHVAPTLALAIVGAASAAICWRLTSSLHRLP